MANLFQKIGGFINPTSKSFLGGIIEPTNERERQIRSIKRSFTPPQGMTAEEYYNRSQNTATPIVGLPTQNQATQTSSVPTSTIQPTQVSSQIPQTTTPQSFTTPSGLQVDAQGNPMQPTGQQVATGNPQLDSLLQNLPQIQKALGIGVETPEQIQAREQQTQSLNRLIELQGQLAKSGAPDETITELDKMIQETEKALRTTSPEELFKSTPQFQAEGITTGQLARESATRRAPIAQALSDLMTSRSIFGEAQQRQREFIEQQIQGQQGVFEMQQAIQALQPQTGIPKELQSSIFKGLVDKTFEDPLDRQYKQAQIANIQSQIAERQSSGNGIGQLLGGQALSPETERVALNQIISGLPDATAREGAYGAVASFKNARDIVGLLDEGVKTGPLSGLSRTIGRPFGLSTEKGQAFDTATTLFTANYIKALSGVQVTDKEREFIQKALPSPFTQEKYNKTNLKQLMDFLRNKYELTLGVDIDQFPTELPNAFSTKGADDYLSSLGL